MLLMHEIHVFIAYFCQSTGAAAALAGGSALHSPSRFARTTASHRGITRPQAPGLLSNLQSA
jgi:hypothetical protein